jgi:diaminopimelate epimerase
MKLKFTKMHGLGNDFIILENIAANYTLTAAQIRALADRKLGIGCDQLLVIEAASDQISDFRYRIYNSDGSEAGQCGNGARCFIRYVVERGLIERPEVVLQTNNRIIRGTWHSAELISVDMGEPDFTPTSIPLHAQLAASYHATLAGQEMSFYALSMGNPHAVVIVKTGADLADQKNLGRLGRAVQQSQLFPESVNVNFVYIDDSANQIELVTYERGVGFTLACGSGACASAAALINAGLVTSPVTINMAGGQLQVSWSGSGSLLMHGPAAFVYDGEIELCAN